MNKDPIMYSCIADVKFDESENEYYIEFNEDLMREMDWHVGDLLEWIDNEDGTYTVRNKDREQV